MKKNVIKILKALVNFYNVWYGVINAIVGIFILTCLHNTFLILVLIGFIVLDIFTWYKNIFKNLNVKRELMATYRENNSIAILGGIGSGKSTLANHLLSSTTPANLRYYNVRNVGYKAFTNEHLLLKKKLEVGAGVLVDEAGAQVDAFHYDKKDDSQTRKRVEFLNKFFRQWYSDKAHLIYVDQAQGNMNTSLYRNVYYVIQCKGVDKRPSGFLLNLLAKIILFFVNRKRPKGQKINNPFTNVSIEFMEFVKLGEYADHYNINIEDRDHKKLVGSIYTFFGSLDTYVFRDFNPAKKDRNPYVWGTSKRKDNKIMESNFSLHEMKKEVKDSFLKY